MTAPLESEFKLRALGPLEVAAVDAVVRDAGWTCSQSDRRELVDIYLDDDAGSLTAAGLGLRLRRESRGDRLCVKHAATPRDGLFVRAEREAPWAGGEPPTTAAALPTILCDEIEPFVRQRPLRPFLLLTTTRELRRLCVDGRELCELTIDAVTASADGRTAGFAEVELEIVDDLAAVERLAQQLCQQLPLQAAATDKPGHAAELLGLPRRAGPTPPGTTLGAAVSQRLQHHLRELQRGEAAMRSGEGPDALHQLRVALRRLRSLVRAMRDLWPEGHGQQLLASLSTYSRDLGQPRDLDVLIDLLAETPGQLPAPLHDATLLITRWLTAEREQGTARLVATLRDPTHQAQMQALEERLQQIDGQSMAAAEPVAAAAAARLQRHAGALRKLCRDLPPELPFAATHTLRVAGKRLRYLAEEFPAEERAAAGPRLLALQQHLGVVCDHEVATTKLLGLLPQAASHSDDPLVAAALGGLATAQARLARKARRAARRALQRIDRKKFWRLFRPPEPSA